MQELATVAFYLGVIAYSAAATLFFVDLARRDPAAAAGGPGPLGRWAPVALGAGAALHATHVVTASLLTHVCPVESLHFALSLSALIAAAAYLVPPEAVSASRDRRLRRAGCAHLSRRCTVRRHARVGFGRAPHAARAAHHRQFDRCGAVLARRRGGRLLSGAGAPAQGEKARRSDREAAAARCARQHRTPPAARGVSAA